MNKPISALKLDEEAVRFVETADLCKHDLSGFTPTRFEFHPKAAHLDMRLPLPLLDAVKAQAKACGVPYTRFVREALEQAVNNGQSPTP